MILEGDTRLQYCAWLIKAAVAAFRRSLLKSLTVARPIMKTPSFE